MLATVALWVAVGAWNEWFDTYIFASSKQELSTLQYEMMKLLSSSLIQSKQPNPNVAAESSGYGDCHAYRVKVGYYDYSIFADYIHIPVSAEILR